MATLVAETDIEGMVGYAIAADNGRRPTTAQAALMIAWAESLIKGELKAATLTDTYGALKVVELCIIMRMIINQRALSNPDAYAIQDVTLTPTEIRLIRIATGSFEFHSFEVGE